MLPAPRSRRRFSRRTIVKENAFTIHDGVIAVRTGATLTPLTKHWRMKRRAESVG